MVLELERLDSLEAPMSTVEGVLIVAGAFVAGALLGAGLALLIT